MLQSIKPVVLTGHIQPLGPDNHPSGMNKSKTAGPWQITFNGIAGDQQADLKNHGGAQKAIHHYPLDHHPVWREEIGEHRLLGSAGAFGENFSTSGWSETNVHVGDVIRFGAALLQVSQGRAPCWKLNARFDVADMAYRVQSTGKTGWYYRVLEEGIADESAELVLVDRLRPEWPLARLIRLMYREKHSYDEFREMSEIPELAEPWRELIRKRVEKRSIEDWSKRLGVGS